VRPLPSTAAAAARRVGRRLPPGYAVSRHGRTVMVTAVDVAATASGIIALHGSLAAWASADPAAMELRGRGAAWRVRSEAGEWVVRHFRRGGAVARMLGDRYFRGREPRPLFELRASEAARARGVPTPRVVAAAWRVRGAFYRADLATEYVPDSADLADVTFEGRGGAEPDAAWRAAGALLRVAFDAGVRHPDLNLRNILVSTAGNRVQAWLLDLDRARVEAPSASAERAMLARLRRSRRKLEKRSGRDVPATALAAFHDALGHVRDGGG
jgi:3-deoxy-D-manno-octulosonic acid kinase